MKNTKKILALLLALCMTLALVACGGGEENSGGSTAQDDEPLVINACIASEPETIDPGLISSVDGSTYTQHQFENLMKYQMVNDLAGEDANMHHTEVVPGQAASDGAAGRRKPSSGGCLTRRTGGGRCAW